MGAARPMPLPPAAQAKYATDDAKYYLFSSVLLGMYFVQIVDWVSTIHKFKDCHGIDLFMMYCVLSSRNEAYACPRCQHRCLLDFFGADDAARRLLVTNSRCAHDDAVAFDGAHLRAVDMRPFGINEALRWGDLLPQRLSPTRLYEPGPTGIWPREASTEIRVELDGAATGRGCILTIADELPPFARSGEAFVTFPRFGSVALGLSSDSSPEVSPFEVSVEVPPTASALCKIRFHSAPLRPKDDRRPHTQRLSRARRDRGTPARARRGPPLVKRDYAMRMGRRS